MAPTVLPWIFAVASLLIFEGCQSAPFLLSPTFLTSASAASSSSLSSPSSPEEPEIPPAPPSNVADLRATKPKTRLAKLSEDDDFPNDPTIGEADQPNEVQPGILQKKISKILRKLHFLAMVRDSVLPTGHEARSNDEDFAKEFDEVETESALDDVDVDEVESNSNNKPSKLEFSDFNPANLGVYLLELLGSVFGLAYGAAAQIQESTKTTTPLY